MTDQILLDRANKYHIEFNLALSKLFMQNKQAPTLFEVLTFVFLFFISGCGYFEKDNTDYQINIVGNIKITKQENSAVSNIVFTEANENFAVIVEDCKSVYYDSSRQQLFVDSYLNKTNRNFYQINILNAFSKEVLNGIEKVQINDTDFINRIKTISKKWSFEE